MLQQLIRIMATKTRKLLEYLNFALEVDSCACPSPRHPWGESETAAWQAVRRVLSTKPSESTPEWCIFKKEEAYGAVILTSTSDVDESTVFLHVVSLDQWEFGGCDDIALTSSPWGAVAAHRPAVLPAGLVRKEDVPALEGKYASALQAVQHRSGSARTAANPHGGHQKTPAFIHAVLMEAIERVSNPTNSEAEVRVLPRGGFTDVGLHTGGAARETSWPLAIAVAHTLLHRAQPPLAQPALCLESMLAQFSLWCAENEAFSISACNPGEVNGAVVALASACRAGAALAADPAVHWNAHDYLLRCNGVRDKLQQLTLASASSIADSFNLRLPPPSALVGLPSPRLTTLLGPGSDTAVSVGTDSLRRVSAMNLAWTPLLSCDATFTQALEWLTARQSAASGTHYVTILATLSMVEALVWKCALCLPSTTAEDAHALHTEAEIAALISLVDAYRRQLRKFQDSTDFVGQMRTVVQSRCVLLVWATFALIHQTAKHTHPYLTRYAVALHFQDLQHCVLSDCCSISVLVRVSHYLYRHSDGLRDSCGVAFSGRPLEVSGTHLVLADSATHEPYLQAMWAKEQVEARARRDQHWGAVQAKKQTAVSLRQEIASYQVELARYSYDGTRYERNQHNRVQDCLNYVQHQLNLALVPPPPVLQPLPANPGLGLLTVAFMHMRPLLRALARWSFEAYDVLAQADKQLLFEGTGTDKDAVYAQYYAMHAGGRVPAAGDVAYCTHSPDPPKHWQAGSVDQLGDESSDVWHPTAFEPFPTWTGGPLAVAGFPCNPFIPIENMLTQMASKYTEKLPDSEQLQWALPLPSDKYSQLTRGNAGVARQNERPTWLRKEEYLSFCALRAHPRQQMRRLCAILKARQLPFDRSAVHTLIKQAMYHVGQLSYDITGEARAGTGADTAAVLEGIGGAGSSIGAGNNTIRMDWKADLLQGDAIAVLQDILSQLAEEITNAPRRHNELPLFGELAAFLGAFEGAPAAACRLVARQFAGIAIKWADDLQPQVDQQEGLGAVTIVAGLHAKQHMYVAHAIICFGPCGTLSSQDAATLCELRVRLNSTQALCDDFASVLRTRLPNEVAAQAVLSAHIRDMVPLLLAAPDALSRAVECVLPLSAHSDWTQIPGTGGNLSTCFETQTPEGNYVTLNVLNGIVLCNGSPPHHLPISIVEHTLYKRVFGARNCAVVAQADGSMQTTTKLFGRDYNFKLFGSQLIVHELYTDDPADAASQFPLRLVPAGRKYRNRLLDSSDVASCVVWGAELPPRLTQLHSHWLVSEVTSTTAAGYTGVVMFRPVHFSQHATQFLAVESSSPLAEKAALFRVPKELWGKPLAELVAKASRNFDRMVVPNDAISGVTGVIAKFEAPEFIEAYMSPTSSTKRFTARPEPGTLRIVLPRYQLEFELVLEENVSSPHAAPHGRPAPPSVPVNTSQLDDTRATATSPGIDIAHRERGVGAAVLNQAAHRPHQLMLRSIEHRGFRLANCQQLSDTLAGFTRYLVLEPINPHSAEMLGQSQTRVLLPNAPVVELGASPAGLPPTPTTVDIQQESRADAALATHVFSAHARFGIFTASHNAARLQLAALYAATGTLLPEPRTSMTGGEHAMELVRQCWVNRPLSLTENAFLTNVGQFCSRTPALALLCDELHRSSLQVAFLFANGFSAPTDSVSLNDLRAHANRNQNARIQYTLGYDTIEPCNARLRLTDDEELFCFGSVLAQCKTQGPRALRSSCVGSRTFHPLLEQTLDVKCHPADTIDVPEMEAALLQLTQEVLPDGSVTNVGFPLGDTSTSRTSELTALDNHMRKELQDSWDTFVDLPTQVLAQSVPACVAQCTETLCAVRKARADSYAAILSSVMKTPASTAAVPFPTPAASTTAMGGRGSAAAVETAARTTSASTGSLNATGAVATALPVDTAGGRTMFGSGDTLSEGEGRYVWVELLKASNDIPQLTQRDAVRASWQPLSLRRFNPYLSPRSLSNLQAAAQQWMQLCVLEDRLVRVLVHLTSDEARKHSQSHAVRELCTVRKWNAERYPQWLAFEMEGGLQIRPEQYALLRNLIDKPGSISQLNMGLGKTRVLLPCLVLELANGQPSDAPTAPGNLVRLFCLAQLIDEAYDMLHQKLCASVLGRHLYRLPFHRGIQLTVARTTAMTNCLKRCQRSAGAVVMAPEHQLSLLLKWHELDPALLECELTDVPNVDSATVRKGLMTIDSFPYLDVFDEADEILRHSRQLVYSIGLQRSLPDGPHRWQMVSAVLRVLTTDDAVLTVLREKGVAKWDDTAKHHEFNALNLLPGDALESASPRLHAVVIAAILKALRGRCSG